MLMLDLRLLGDSATGHLVLSSLTYQVIIG